MECNGPVIRQLPCPLTKENNKKKIKKNKKNGEIISGSP